MSEPGTFRRRTVEGHPGAGVEDIPGDLRGSDPVGKVMRLEKLHPDHACHGRSIGNMGINHVLDAARRSGAGFVTLNVNKGNLRAQKAYCRAGFYRWRSEKEDVGNGFFKDDFIMRYDIIANG